jgi:hypothetical protein
MKRLLLALFSPMLAIVPMASATDLFTEVRNADAKSLDEGAYADTREIRMNPQALFSKSAFVSQKEFRWTSTEVRGNDDVTYRGDGITLTSYKGTWWGLINGTQVIHSRGTRVYLSRFDEARLPFRGSDDVVFRDTTPHAQVIEPKDGQMYYIDVLMLYTPERRDAVGGDVAVQGQLQWELDLANTTEINSGTTTRYRVVAFRLADPGPGVRMTVESGFDWLRDTPLFWSWKKQLQADVMSLAVEEGVNAGGVAPLSLDPGVAFNVHAEPRFSDPYVFTHECGHLRNGDHDLAYAVDSTGSHHGDFWVNSDGLHRTPLAYPFACGVNCTAVPIWSSPSLTWDGVPTGHAGVSELAELMRQTGSIVARHVVRETSVKLAARWFAPTAKSGSRFSVFGTFSGEFGAVVSKWVDLYRGLPASNGACQGRPFARVSIDPAGSWVSVIQGWKAAPANVCITTSQGVMIVKGVRSLPQ